MAGDNMESILLNDDSSSGESDAEVTMSGSGGVASTTTTTAATSVVGASMSTPAPASTKMPVASAVQQTTSLEMTTDSAAVTSSTPQPIATSQSELAARLKSMYSPATKKTVATGPAAQTATMPLKTVPGMPIQTQQPHIHQHQQVQQVGAYSNVSQIPPPQQMQQQKSLTKSSQPTTMPPNPPPMLPMPPQHSISSGAGSHRSTSSGMRQNHPIAMQPGQQQQPVIPSYSTASTSRPMMIPAVPGGPPQDLSHQQSSSHRRTSGGSTMSNSSGLHKKGSTVPGGGNIPPQQKQHQSYQHMNTGTNNHNAPPPTSSRSSMHPQGGRMMSSHTSNAVASDPYEPTPVSTIIERSKHQQQPITTSTVNSGVGGNHPPLPSTTGGYSSGPPTSLGTSFPGSVQPMPGPANSGMGPSGNVGSSHQRQLPPGGGRGGGSTLGGSLGNTSGSIGTVSGGSNPPLSSAVMTNADREKELKKYKERFLVFTRVLMKYLEQKDPPLHQKVKGIIKDCADRNKRQEPGYESVTASMRSRLKAVVHDSYWKKAEMYLDQFLKGKPKGAGNTPASLGSSNFDPSSGSSLSMAFSGNQSSSATTTSSTSSVNRLQLQGSSSSASSRSGPHQPGSNPASLGLPMGVGEGIQQANNTMSQQDKRRLSMGTGGTSTNQGQGITSNSSHMHQQTSMPGPHGFTPMSVSATSTDPKKAGKARNVKSSSKAVTMPSGLSKQSLPVGVGVNVGNLPTPMMTENQTPTGMSVFPTTQGSVGPTPSVTGTVPTDNSTLAASQQQTTSVQAAANKQQQQLVTKPAMPPPSPPRDYNEYMELVDHAVNYDWTVAGLLMGKEQVTTLSVEQLALFDETRRSVPASYASTIAPLVTSSPSFPIHGWGRRNVLSARSSWALLRLREESFLRSRSAAAANVTKTSTTVDNSPGLVNVNGLPNSQTPMSSTSIGHDSQSVVGSVISSNLKQDTPYEHSWQNEEKAEEDKVLAIISEGLQIYLKGVLEKAVHCARQRYNVDGIRLWHQQTALALKIKATSKDTSGGNNSTNKKDNTTNNNTDNSGSSTGSSIIPPQLPLVLRLGCDVPRQVAQAAGNAAMIVKRMEEALERQSIVRTTDVFTKETETSCLLQAQSMSDVALLPRLSTKAGVDAADYCAKRSFEIYGGKNSTNEPPLGRIPKQPKLEVVDFQLGMNLYTTPRRGGTHKRRSRAGTMSSSFCY